MSNGWAPIRQFAGRGRRCRGIPARTPRPASGFCTKSRSETPISAHMNGGDYTVNVSRSVPHVKPTSTKETGFQNKATSPSASSLRGSPLTSGGTGEGQGPFRTDALEFPTGYVGAAPSTITPSRSPPCDGVTIDWAVTDAKSSPAPENGILLGKGSADTYAHSPHRSNPPAVVVHSYLLKCGLK
jgi:hypothetical protein